MGSKQGGQELHVRPQLRLDRGQDERRLWHPRVTDGAIHGDGGNGITGRCNGPRGADISNEVDAPAKCGIKVCKSPAPTNVGNLGIPCIGRWHQALFLLLSLLLAATSRVALEQARDLLPPIIHTTHLERELAEALGVVGVRELVPAGSHVDK